mmetsp:Transcript_54847/g.101471  ORF Transcript_54847/g.101471 Transcript_54847/m.101471 type:complete len:507 (-) Transcript_54847:78-1598(-)
MANVPYLGSKISLITTSDIRYEGVLYTLNREESTIAVQNVRSFGTEGRRRPEVPVSNEIYDFIIFRGKDLKDLTVLQASADRLSNGVGAAQEVGFNGDASWQSNLRMAQGSSAMEQPRLASATMEPRLSNACGLEPRLSQAAVYNKEEIPWRTGAPAPAAVSGGTARTGPAPCGARVGGLDPAESFSWRTHPGSEDLGGSGREALQTAGSASVKSAGHPALLRQRQEVGVRAFKDDVEVSTATIERMDWNSSLQASERVIDVPEVHVQDAKQMAPRVPGDLKVPPRTGEVKERPEDAKARGKGKAGAQKKTLAEVLRYHQRAQDLIVKAMRQQNSSNLSPSELRAMSESSPSVYHFCLDFVNYCCPAHTVSSDEQQWDMLSRALKKHFEKEFGSMQAQKPPAPQRPNNTLGDFITMEAASKASKKAPKVTRGSAVPRGKGAGGKKENGADSGDLNGPDGLEDSSSQSTTWACPRCTLRNENFLVECAACGTSKQQAALWAEFPPLG